MKNLLYLSLALLLLSGCNVYQKAVNIANNNCVGVNVYDSISNTTTITYTCSELWEFKKAKQHKIASANICVDAVTGSIEGKVIYVGKK